MQKQTVFAIASCAGFAATALAGGDFVLGDGNSTATFSPDQGQIDWNVDGVNQLFTQEFYIRRSTDTQELRVDSINFNNVGNFATDTNGFTDTRDDAFGSLFTDGNGLEIETLFTLRGNTAGSNSSSLAEVITLRNTSSSSMTLSFFQFVDFDLGTFFSDDSGEIVNGNTAFQYDGGSSILSETATTPSPDLFQMGNGVSLRAMLADGSIDDLDGTAAFAGDVGWAFQWNITLAAGDSFLISKNKTLVPTPGSMMLLGTAGLLASRRRRS
ncbi:MAG: PEP-CTERM sorting domain-containing protein [Phycisphaerales bacterium]|nr:PEP-CTERM sorting domain-containing protein [Phycisphaerales bacterium]